MTNLQKKEMLEDMASALKQMPHAVRTSILFVREMESFIQTRQDDLFGLCERMISFFDASYDALPEHLLNFTVIGDEKDRYTGEKLRTELKNGLIHLVPAALIGRIVMLCSRNEKSLTAFRAKVDRYLENISTSEMLAKAEFTRALFGSLMAYVTGSDEIQQMESLVALAPHNKVLWGE